MVGKEIKHNVGNVGATKNQNKMAKSLYKSKTRWEQANEISKLSSKYDRKRYIQKKLKEKIIKNSRKRKAQQTLDHDLLEIIKERYPKEFEVCLKEFLQPKDLREYMLGKGTMHGEKKTKPELKKVKIKWWLF